MRGSAWILCVAFALPPAAASAASFDCDKAKSAQEKLICADEFLSEADWDLGRLYDAARRALKGPAKTNLLADQRHWNKEAAVECPIAGEAETKEAKQCLALRYSQRRHLLADSLQQSALEAAPEIRAGPYIFKQPIIHFSDSNESASLVLIGQTREVAEAFNSIFALKRNELLNRCEEQTSKDSIELVTNQIVNVRTESWMYCQGAAHGYGHSFTITVVMQPKPHRLSVEDVFRRDSDWQRALAEGCDAVLEEEEDLTESQEADGCKLALDPINWAVTPGGLKIQFGWLKGYVGGEIEDTIGWEKFQGMLVIDPPPPQ